MVRLITYKEALDRLLFDNQGGFQGIWDAVGQIGAAAAQTAIPIMFGQPSGGQARGLAAINAFGRQAIDTLNQIAQMMQNGQLQPAQAASEAQRIAAALSDPQYVYQAQRGSDAAALNQFKAQAAEIVRQIQSAVGAGRSTATAAATPISGLSVGPMAILIGGMGLLLLLKR